MNQIPGSHPIFATRPFLANVVAHTEAVGSQPGHVQMVETSDGSGGGTTIASEHGIPRIGLMEAVERLGGRCDLAKIDCEGGEWDLFAAKSAWEKIQQVRMGISS